jgi:hypothetical protein
MSAFKRYLKRCVEDEFGKVRRILQKLQNVKQENALLKKDCETLAKRNVELLKQVYLREKQ